MSDLLQISGIFIGISLITSGLIFSIKFFSFRRKNVNALITHGMYNHIRHPQYLPILMILLSFLIIRTDVINLTLLLSSLIVIHLSIKKEESQLIERFGKEYKEYMKRVSWRIIPKVY